MELSTLHTELLPFIVAHGGATDVRLWGASADSRTVRPGWLFCAMKGEHLDGHDFIPQALSNGAAAILLERPVPLPAHIPWLQVHNAYRAIGLVAELFAGKPAEKLHITAVTGTNGKTTTAWLLRELLRADGRNTGLVGTIEYDLGKRERLPADRTTPTPFFLQELFSRMRRNGVTDVALEASSHALEQGRLGTAKCTAAIFTNLTEDHLDYHKTMEQYYQAKKLLFTRHLAPNAPAILNCDDPTARRLVQELQGTGNLLRFAFREQLDSSTPTVHCSNLQLTPAETSFSLRFPDGQQWNLHTPMPGFYNASNVAGAAIAAWTLKIPQETVERVLAACYGAPGRLQPVPVPGNRFAVFVDYAHTDDALSNVLSTLQSLPHNRILTVFGCGGDRDRTKRPKMGAAAAKLSDVLYVTSDNPRTEDPNDIIREILPGIPGNTTHFTIPDRRTAIRQAIADAQTGDILLVAGKGHEDYQEIQGLKHHFNDAEEIAKALELLENTS
ncbi:MAG: UDP-N-acetylmuramoyl-L-alanyl-D-glutamate--2,6-diaminopimelate ligase [Victivallales bacterium]|nr:UDP-N-acetylmuramoyl-L-alanyl-D-glutamate--2,6-diaminopimelate ligase [Victivallales bacterium]